MNPLAHLDTDDRPDDWCDGNGHFPTIVLGTHGPYEAVGEDCPGCPACAGNPGDIGEPPGPPAAWSMIAPGAIIAEPGIPVRLDGGPIIGQVTEFVFDPAVADMVLGSNCVEWDPTCTCDPCAEISAHLNDTIEP